MKHLLDFNYYFDLAVKGGIALLLSIGAWHFKHISEKIDSLEEKTYEKSSQIAVLQADNAQAVRQLDRIEQKLDKIWEITRKAS